MNLTAVLHSPLAKGAASGALAAFTTDLLAFRKWTSFHDAVEYDWSIALFRWCQGAFFGAIAAAGLGAIS